MAQTTPQIKIVIPKPLATLLDMYMVVNSESGKPAALAVEGIERFIADSSDFLEFMARMKENSPDIYRKMGGDYLDQMLPRIR